MARVGYRKGAKMERFERNVDRPTAALKQIGALMVSASQMAFKEQAFGRTSWRERSTPNVYGILADLAKGGTPPERRFQARPALQDTGRLKGSISFSLGSKHVEVGSNLPYAAVHQEGGPIESEEITEDIQSRLWEWLQTQGDDRKKQLGWLLNKKFTGTTLTGEVPARPFVGLTPQLRKDIFEVVGVKVFEVKG